MTDVTDREAAHDAIDASVGQWDPLRRREERLDGRALRLGRAPRQDREHLSGEIERDDPCAARGGGEREIAGPGTDVQDDEARTDVRERDGVTAPPDIGPERQDAIEE